MILQNQCYPGTRCIWNSQRDATLVFQFLVQFLLIISTLVVKANAQWKSFYCFLGLIVFKDHREQIKFFTMEKYLVILGLTNIKSSFKLSFLYVFSIAYKMIINSCFFLIKLKYALFDRCVLILNFVQCCSCSRNFCTVMA